MLMKMVDVARELADEVEQLDGFVGDERYASDYQTAGDMRLEIERLRKENARLKEAEQLSGNSGELNEPEKRPMYMYYCFAPWEEKP